MARGRRATEMNPMAPQSLLDLVEKFDQNRESYTAPTYNETQLRLEFLNPLLDILGWDVTNRQGYAEAYKEVIHEDAVKIGGVMKAPVSMRNCSKHLILKPVCCKQQRPLPVA